MTTSTSKKEPKRREDEKGKWRLMNGNVLTKGFSFDTKSEARAWDTWNNFGEPTENEIIENPDV